MKSFSNSSQKVHTFFLFFFAKIAFNYSSISIMRIHTFNDWLGLDKIYKA